MATSLRSRTLALLAAMGAALAVPATAHAAPTGSSAGLPALTLPVITSIELPPVSIPGGSLRPITVVARPAMRTLQYPPPPPAVEFSVPNLMPHDTWLESRYLRVTWQNLRSGKDGAVNLRYWRKGGPKYPGMGSSYPETLPTAAVAATGAGPIIARVEVLWQTYGSKTLIPGVIALDLPA
ncbi:hypothetical protein M2359_002464 [Gordonia amarae]|uniref:Uncharacterized protein n=1 Tax=Gordonia amarae NBRC 15530 TaxID=1075090 RepID=G7GVY2_9ACTN|nr:hypothetical protein [Gordonia amarae]MCS3878835.1 hypothetical protein [Gordonia amarae]GAB07757.1 hypothetical protein GOAMR_71_01100 [Gordonia amarae NBRC 15530]